MKTRNIIIGVIALIVLISTAYAGDLLDEVGLGRGCGTLGNQCPLGYTASDFIEIGGASGLVPPTNSTANIFNGPASRYTLFFQQKYRKATYQLEITHAGGNTNMIFWVNTLNTTNPATEQVWTLVSKNYIFFNATNGTTPYLVNFTTDTNTGILILGATGSTPLYRIKTGSGDSTISYIGTEAVAEPMIAGSTYTIPMVNWYYPQETYGFDDGFNNVLYSTNTSGLYYTTITPSCSATTDETTRINFVNQNSSNIGDKQLFEEYFNITEITELNFTTVYPANNSIIKVPVGSIVNFSVVPNSPAAVDTIVLYKGGSTEIINPATNGTFHYQFNTVGNYTVEIQVEDNNCLRYPTAVWVVEVGKTISLGGTVYSNESGIQWSLPDATVTINSSSSFFRSTQTNEYGIYEFTNLLNGTYTIVFSKNGYSSVTYTRTLTYGTNANTAWSQDALLNSIEQNASLILRVFDATTYAGINNFTLNLYLGGELVLTSYNGTNSLVKYGIVSLTDENDIGVYGLGLNVPYTAIITRSGYSQGSTTVTFTVDDVLAEEYIYLNKSIVSTCSVNWSNPMPVDGSTINVSEAGTSIKTNLTMQSSSHGFTVCSSYRKSGFGWVQTSCYPYSLSGIINLTDTFYGLEADQTYYFVYTASNNSVCSSPFSYEGYFNTIGTTTTTSTTEITLSPTTRPKQTTTSSTSTTYNFTTTTTLGNFTSGAYNNISFNCTNMTGMLQKGDIFHCAVCPFIMVLGVSMFYGLVFIFIVFTTYVFTKNFAAAGIISLLYTSVFLQVLPQPTLNYVSVGVGIGFGLMVYGVFRR